MNNFLIVNAYSHRNKGDAAIVVSMIQLIKYKYPGAVIKVMSNYAEDNKEYYNQYGADSVGSVWNINSSKSKISKYIKGLKLVMMTLFVPADKTFKEYEWADVVYSAGGGYLYSSRLGPLGLGLMSSLFHLWLGTRLNKKVVAFPQSVNGLNYFLDRFVTKQVVSKISLFISREAFTTNLLTVLGCNNVVQIPDVALYLRRDTQAEVSLDGEIKVGVTVLDWRFAKAKSTEADVTRYLCNISDAIKGFIRSNPKTKIYIFPQVDVGGVDSDVHVSNMLHEMIGGEFSCVYHVSSSLSPSQVIALYGNMDIFIGSRMHSTIFAIDAGVYTIGLSYQDKMDGTFEVLGLSERIVPCDDFTASKLLSLMEKYQGSNVGSGIVSDFENELLKLM